MKEFYNKDHSKPLSDGTVYINKIRQSPVLNRISLTCEGCGQSESYNIHKKKIIEGKKNFFPIFVSCKTRYYLSCPQCSFVMELKVDEYETLKKIAYKKMIQE